MKTNLYQVSRSADLRSRIWHAWLTPAEHAALFLCLLAGWASPHRAG